MAIHYGHTIIYWLTNLLDIIRVDYSKIYGKIYHYYYFYNYYSILARSKGKTSKSTVS